MARISQLLALLGMLITLAAAAAPTFCKCTCFKSSEIIPLTPGYTGPSNPNPAPNPSDSSPSSTSSDAAPTSKAERRNHPVSHRASSASCAQCNRAFCLNYNLPICKGAEEKDVVTMCFQRDSRKDQIIVWGFILGTAGLLGWAGLQRIMEMREGRKGDVAATGGLGAGARRSGMAPARGAADRGPYRQVEGEDSPAG